jgi:hypothetical protein
MFNPVSSNMSGLTWSDARQYCKAQGADLVVAKSSKELFVLLIVKLSNLHDLGNG